MNCSDIYLPASSMRQAHAPCSI